ncbi:MAG: hypothetical protein J5658_11335 [Prevotella sp.]|nr:hypothetical protein [Prevotella sp.]
MMRKLLFAFMMLCALLLTACGGKKAQGEGVNADSVSMTSERQQYIKTENGEYDSIVVKGYDPQEQEMVDIKAFVEQFYMEWDDRDLLDYGYVKQYITPNLLKYLADEYDYDCEGECLATWKFFYEGGGDVSGLKSRQITARDGSHVLVENNYENYEYDVLLKVIKDGDTFKIDSLKQEKSEYIH